MTAPRLPVRWWSVIATYRYCSTDLITGAILSDNLPLNVQSFGMQLNGSGSLTASLNLNEVYSINRPFIEALECRRAVLWALADDYPVWCGPVWDWPDMTRAQGTLSISAQTMDTVFNYRLVTDTIEYAQLDLFEAFLDLVSYGQTKQSSYISSVSPPATRPQAYLDYVAKCGGVANLIVPQGAQAGVPWTASYTYSDLTEVSSAWQDMAASGQLEYAFVPGLTSNGQLATFLRLGYEQLGRPLTESGYSLVYPGNLLDYGYQRTGSQGANYIWATAPPAGAELQWQSQWPHGVDLADLDAGYPLMEATVSWEGSFVTSQAMVDSFADGEVAIYTQAMTSPTVNIAGGMYPGVKDIVLGDTTLLVATSPLHPPQQNGQKPGLQQQVRVVGWTCYPSGPQQSEYIQLQTSGVVVGQ